MESELQIKLYDQINNIIELSLKNGSEPYITSYIILRFTILVVIAIFGNQNKSHDQINNIFELRTIYNITVFYHDLYYSYFRNTLPWSKSQMNE